MSAPRLMRALAGVLALVWLGGCATLFGPRPQPQPPDISREKAVRGSSLFEEGRLDRAERDFKSAFYMDQAEDRQPALARDYENLAALASRQGDYPAALEYLARAADIRRRGGDNDGLARTLAGMAAVADLAGRPEEAAKLIEEALGLVPGQGAPRLCVLNTKAWHLLETGDAAGAEAVAREAVATAEADPGIDIRLRAAAGHYLGRVLAERGRTEEAGKLFEAALELDRAGKYPAGIAADLDQLASLAAAGGRPEEAARLYERAFNIFVYLKDVRRARQVLARLETEYGQARLAGSLTRLREALTQVEEAAAREAAGRYSLGRTSTTQ